MNSATAPIPAWKSAPLFDDGDPHLMPVRIGLSPARRPPRQHPRLTACFTRNEEAPASGLGWPSSGGFARRMKGRGRSARCA